MADERTRDSTEPTRFLRAIAAIDAANARDPREVETELGSRPLELVQSERVFAWVQRLCPAASEALLLASRAHHLERWRIPRSRYPAGRAGYLRWRKQLQKQHAQGAASLLEPLGYDSSTIQRVGELIRKRGLGRDEEVAVLEDALCLVFLETQLAEFAKAHPAPVAASVLAKTLAKMSPRAREAARALDLAASVRSLVVEALGSLCARSGERRRRIHPREEVRMTTRRVVTGIDSEGKSFFVHDGSTPGQLDLGIALDEEIWVDDPARPDPDAKRDPATAEVFYLEPPKGGSVVRVFTFLPGSRDPERVRLALTRSAARFDTGHAMEPDNPGMHTTATIDYGIVLTGEIDLELDRGAVHLQAGDVVVQRGTRHAWRNSGSQPCSIAFILIASPSYAGRA